MNAVDLMLIMKHIQECPDCGSTTVNNGKGSLKVDEHEVTRTCSCGFAFTYDARDGVTDQQVDTAFQAASRVSQGESDTRRTFQYTFADMTDQIPQEDYAAEKIQAWAMLIQKDRRPIDWHPATVSGTNVTCERILSQEEQDACLEALRAYINEVTDQHGLDITVTGGESS